MMIDVRIDLTDTDHRDTVQLLLIALALLG